MKAAHTTEHWERLEMVQRELGAARSWQEHWATVASYYRRTDPTKAKRCGENSDNWSKEVMRLELLEKNMLPLV